MFGLYKGLASPLVGLTFINAIIFGVHGNLYRQMVPGAKSQFVAGTIAGMVQSLILCPMELAKIKLQIQGQGLRLDKTQRTYLGPIDCLKKVLATEGVSGCFRGLTMTLIRDGPGFGAYFAIYHLLCLSFVPRGKTVADLGPLPLLISGGLTGMITWAIVYPTDVIKSRIQAEGIVPFGKYKSNWDCIAQSYSKEGLGVFTRGLYVTIFRAFPVNAATFAAFTLSLRFMNDLKL